MGELIVKSAYRELAERVDHTLQKPLLLKRLTFRLMEADENERRVLPGAGRRRRTRPQQVLLRVRGARRRGVREAARLAEIPCDLITPVRWVAPAMCADWRLGETR